MDFETKKEKLEVLIRHIDEVQKNCKLLGDRLVSEDKASFEFAKKLIANSYLHDNSKFSTLEWKHLTNADEDDEMLNVVIEEHGSRNFHHPEYWFDGIKGMPEIYLAECVVDWFTRSNEMGTDFFDWINRIAANRWKFTKRDKIYRKIMKFANLLVTKM